ncbi:MAG: hypothetical protein JXA99_12255 [Candidatus Lokiarchaeota archaeon]|nr:hypothetical protein [Candidatus Lokiarchaeota archaeon]
MNDIIWVFCLGLICIGIGFYSYFFTAKRILLLKNKSETYKKRWYYFSKFIGIFGILSGIGCFFLVNYFLNNNY